jgi:hypothetical protein
MTIPFALSESYYRNDRRQSVHSANHSFLFPLEDHGNADAESIRTLFAPSAGAFYVYQPSKQRRILNRVVDRLKASCLPGFEYATSYLYDKYRRKPSVASLSQAG